MIALIHLIIVLIKIAILSSIYALVVLVAFRIIGHYKPERWFKKVSQRKMQLWFRSGFIISVCLLCYRFSYFGDDGLGDSARVPIGHWRAIQEVDGVQAYIQDEGPVRMIPIDRFIVTDDYVYGTAGDFNENYEGRYFVYDMVNNKVTTFKDERDYKAYLKRANLENTGYKDFNHYYRNYWGGWRQWLLP